MKTEFTITKEQIETIYADGCTYIKELFPEAFENNLKYGRWIKGSCSLNWLVFQVDKKRLYGFNSKGGWFEIDTAYDATKDLSNSYATKEEVETALINEAEKRGFKSGMTIKESSKIKEIRKNGNYYFNFGANHLAYKGVTLFYNGIWAEIIEEKLTIEQRIERLEKLNKL